MDHIRIPNGEVWPISKLLAKASTFTSAQGLRLGGTLEIPSVPAGNPGHVLNFKDGGLLDSDGPFRGKVIVRNGGKLALKCGADTGAENASFDNIDFVIEKGGKLTLTGKPLFLNDFRAEVSGELELSTETPLNMNSIHGNLEQVILGQGYHPSNAIFRLNSGSKLSGSGVLAANLDIFDATIDPAVSLPEDFPVLNGALPTPSPAYVTVSGSLNMTSGTLNITINTSYYGQLSVLGTVSLGSSTLNMIRSNITDCQIWQGQTTTGYYIIDATNITGAFGAWNALASRFVNQGIYTIDGSEKVYRMIGFPQPSGCP